MVEIYSSQEQKTIAIVALTKTNLPDWLQKQSDAYRQWVGACNFTAEPGAFLYLPSQAGKVEQVLFGVKDAEDFWAFGALPSKLAQGLYVISNENKFFDASQYQRALLAWGLGCYQFDIYAQREPIQAQLYIPKPYNLTELKNLTENLYLVRDLINTPANHMGPDELASMAVKIAEEGQAQIKIIKGDELLSAGFPSIYTVGQAAAKEPHLIDFVWGPPSAPKVTLVGKGVCFDSGGLDIKSASNMLSMKKDMGGAAHVLGLARLIMQSKLAIRLRVLIPAVENSVDGKSYRPGDVIKTRSGITVEVGNTDAEGRVVLSDALTEACSEKPDYLIDFATLTGAARVALGPEIAAMFSNNDDFAEKMLQASRATSDPMWRMPLYQPYADYIKGEIAEISNTGKLPQGGAITAGLFLQRFVDNDIPWMHFDIMGANLDSKPGRPSGGEAQAFRSVFYFLSEKFSV